MSEVFESTNPQTPEVSTVVAPTANDPSKAAPSLTLPKELEGLVGQGKKYATLEEALKSIPHSQEHIARIEAENKQFREKSAEALSLEEVYKYVQEQLASERPSAVTLDPAAVAAQVETILNKRAIEETRNANIAAFRTAVQEVYADKSAEMYHKAAADHGMSVAQLDQLVATSPEAAKTLLGITKRKPADKPANPSVYTSETLQRRETQEVRKPVMFGATEKDVLTAWRRAGAAKE